MDFASFVDETRIIFLTPEIMCKLDVEYELRNSSELKT